jgi:hypothetical protein
MDDITYVGLDVYKPAPRESGQRTVCMAVAESADAMVRYGRSRFSRTAPEILCKMAARLSKGGCRLSFHQIEVAAWALLESVGTSPLEGTGLEPSIPFVRVDGRTVGSFQHEKPRVAPVWRRIRVRRSA